MQHVFTGCLLSRGMFRHKQYSSVLFWAAEGRVTGCLGVRDETRADLCFSITPPQWETLLRQDTSKGLSDISRILVIFYLKQALLLDTVSPPPTPTTPLPHPSDQHSENLPRLWPLDTAQLWHVSTQSEL